MLAKSEKVKIRLEEAYRLEVRNQLQKANQEKRSPAWTFLNSSFGLWLLSAVFITLAGSIYTNYQNSRAESLKNEEMIERLDLEISYRYSQVLIQLYNLTDRNPNGQLVLMKHGAGDVVNVIELLNQQPSGSSASLYSEFSNMSIPALIAELRRHLHDENERSKIDKVLAAVTGGVFDDIELSNVQLVAGRILERMMLQRWKKGYFYFIDCPIPTPFC
jgi:hypothetical protein